MADQPIAESSLLTGPLEPTNEGYALAKISGVRLCKAIYEEQGLSYYSLMPTNLYGPNDNFDLLSAHVPAALMRRFHEAKINHSATVTIWGSGSPLREFMHSDDLATAIWFMLEANPEPGLYNIGSGVEASIKDFSYLMSKVIGFEGQIDFDVSKPDGTPRKLLNSNKVRSLGWESKIGLIEGLKDTYNWYLKALESGHVRGQ